MTDFYVSKLNESSIQSENLLVDLESFNESSASNDNANFYTALELFFVKFDKRLFLKSKVTPSYIFVSPSQMDWVSGLKI